MTKYMCQWCGTPMGNVLKPGLKCPVCKGDPTLSNDGKEDKEEKSGSKEKK